MARIDVHDLEFLENESEKIVLAEIERQLDTLPDYICTCRECILDVLALALNSIKPLYRVTLMGKIYTGIAMDEQNYAHSVHNVVFKAIEKVHKTPYHLPQKEKGPVGHFKQKKMTKG
ncbi:MAG: late competence development ComFB family protein [Treponema sp.]|nr:late competence development ComFB family protein [Treponema sp.]